MNIKNLLLLLVLLTILPCQSQETPGSVASIKISHQQGLVPEGYEEIYNNFVSKFTRKNEDLSKGFTKTPIPDMSFELEYAGLTTFPVVLSNDTYSSTESLEERYKTYKTYHGKTVSANDKMHEERFYQKQEDVRKLYEDLINRNSPREYLILAGTLSTDNGEKIIKDKYIILLNPKYSDREWVQWKVDQHMQKRIALTLTATNGTAMEFLESDRDLKPLAEKYNDPVIKFILEPLPSNGKNQPLPFFSNK